MCAENICFYMIKNKKIKSALVSVYQKDNLDAVVKKLNELQVKIFSTGGTKNYIESLGIPVTAVESVTNYPSIFAGRVKTLHPKIFGGILYRRDEADDCDELVKYDVPEIDLVIVDLYPFKEVVESGAEENEIIENIDIGGVSLIRAAAKNYTDVTVISSSEQYEGLLTILSKMNAETNLSIRRSLAWHAFGIVAQYDFEILKYFSESGEKINPLRYGENPHQSGAFIGDFDGMFDKLHGKEISYNNLLDIEAAVHLIGDFDEPTFAILKHTNPCGVASSDTIFNAWKNALKCDPVSAFGGILIANRTIDIETARSIDEIFYELLIAPDFSPDAIELLTVKKNRILLRQKKFEIYSKQSRTLLTGILSQDVDLNTETAQDMKCVTAVKPTDKQLTDLVFANKIVKHSKSNAIIIVKDKQMTGKGVGQTSRIDALNQALEKSNDFDYSDAVMASDAFFPFPDCVEQAAKAGIKAIVQPGGSIRDNESVECCNKHNISMVLTGIRHFKH